MPTATNALLAIGAHPDDCELFAGGMLAALCAQGHRVVLCDLTRGEAASRGTVEERRQSAQRAAKILGIAERVSLDLGDGGLENTAEHRAAVVEIIRRFRPRAILTHNNNDRHPDHIRAHHLVNECAFYASVGKFNAPGERLESAPPVFYFFGNAEIAAFQPDFIFPVSEEHYALRQQAVAAYESQFYTGSSGAGAISAKTLISSPEYAQTMEARYIWFGGAISVKYGEPYQLQKVPKVERPLDLFLSSSTIS